MPHRRQRLGAAGESAVAERYRAAGYQILDRNWRCREGEIDIVARKGGTLVVCEVKTRSTDAYGTPAEAVTRDKQRRLRVLARRYLEGSRAHYAHIRFDVAAVTPGSVRIIEAAF